MDSSVVQGEAGKVIEFRTEDDSPVEIDETYKEVWAKFSKRLITNGNHAIEVWRLRKRDRLLAAYEEEQKRQQQVQKIETAVAPLRKTDEAKIATRIAAAQAAHEANLFDEEAEAQEFLEAVTTDSWQPLPSDWYEAKVAYRDLRRMFIRLELTDGSQAVCLNRNITHGLAGHTMCVPEGTLAAVRIEKHGNRYRALECRCQNDELIPKTREKLVIRSWVAGKTFGNGVRVCGCSVFATTSFRGGSYAEYGEGDIVEADISQSDRVPGLAIARIL